MMTQNSGTEQTWRDFADQLTAQQIDDLEHWERVGSRDDAAYSRPDYLLGEARDYVANNARDAELNARIQPPKGASVAGGWDSIDDAGHLTRVVQWSSHNAGRASVMITGSQDDTGAVDGPHLLVYGLDGEQISATDARGLAQALTAMADELERLQ